MFKRIDQSKWLQSVIPLILTLVILAALSALLYVFVAFLNILPTGTKISLVVRPVEVLVGITIYLKTAIDFAIFMGRLMSTNQGWRSRVAIEVGTALGNALGTILIIGIWVIFKEVDLLLALMVFLAALVLFELAHGGLEHIEHWESGSRIKKSSYLFLHHFLDFVTKITKPILSKIMPDLGAKLTGRDGLTWKALFVFSLSVPFILGLDDFAGYIPLFNVINILGFSLGVFTAHTLLNIALFLSPSRTIVAVKNEYISFLGTLAFIGLGFYGLYEVFRILIHVIVGV